MNLRSFRENKKTESLKITKDIPRVMLNVRKLKTDGEDYLNVKSVYFFTKYIKKLDNFRKHEPLFMNNLRTGVTDPYLYQHTHLNK